MFEMSEDAKDVDVLSQCVLKGPLRIEVLSHFLAVVKDGSFTTDQL